MEFGPIELAWIVFVFVAVPVLGLWRIAIARDQPRHVAAWGMLSFAGFAIGAFILLSRPVGPKRRDQASDDFGRFDLR